MDTSYLSQQVTTIIERLHGFFDEIGVPTHERDSRESELFSALSETLHNQLNIVAKEKHDLTEEAQHIIKTIREMERSLDDSRPNDEYENDQDGLKITYPLLECIQALKEKQHTIAKLHRERYEQVKKLVEALESYASHLEPSFVSIRLPPTAPNAKIPPNFDLSPTYVSSLDGEFTRVYDEYNKRVAMVSQIGDEIINLWSELGIPQAQVDSNIVQFAHSSPEQLGLHQDDLKRLSGKRDKLVSEKQQRERKLNDLKAQVEGLWDRLGVEDSERRQFLAANRGCGVRQINEFEDELSRLNELKKQNLHLFVEDARFKLQELWDGLYFSEEEMLEFTPAFSDVYSDALLSAHEQEIARLETLKEQRAPILAVIDKHRSIIKDREDLENSSQDASRLMAKGAKGEKRDPGKLLREEKMRKRITKELPKVEAQLRKTLEQWENEYGRPFCVHGERYLDELEAASAKAPPPRSKTPNALQPARDAPKSGGRSAMSQSRAGTMRGAPPQRSKTPTAMGSRNATSQSVMGSSIPASSARNNTAKASPSKASPTKASPSKIPGGSRLPMSSIRDGNNSPERRANGHQRVGSRKEDPNGTIRAPPPRLAPPPKMKDLFVPPTPTSNKENGFDSDRSASVVRHVPPEDPYDESRFPNLSYQNMHSSIRSPAMQPPPRPMYARHDSAQSSLTSSVYGSRPLSMQQSYPVAPPSRAASNTSSVMSQGSALGSTVSGSENWETYTDNSDVDEDDEAYHAKAQAQQQQQQFRHHAQQSQSQYGSIKRPGTAPGLPPAHPKRVQQHAIAEQGFRENSETAWTDDCDDAF